MVKKKKIAKNAAFLISGNATSAALLFIRNILIARFISPEDFGIAATFALTFSLTETMINASLDRFIVQDKEGDSVRFQGTLQSLQVIRGVLGALILVAISVPYSAFLNVPDLAWAYQIMALVPLLRGFANLDIFRKQRTMNFSDYALVLSLSALVGTVAAAGLLFVFDDYRVMLWSIIIHQACYLLLTYYIAERPYRLYLEKSVVERGLQFGMPLLANNILVFFIFQGDRLIIGNQLGPEALGLYSVAFILTSTPITLILGTYQNLALPGLAELQNNSTAFQKMAVLVSEGAFMLGACIAVGVLLLGPFVLILFFGKNYAPSLEFLALLGLVQAIRMYRTGFSCILLSKAETRSILLSNMVQVSAIPFAYIALTWGFGIKAVLYCSIIAECAAFLLSAFLVQRKAGVHIRDLIGPTIVAFTIVLFVIADVSLTIPTGRLAEDLGVLDLGYLILLVVLVFVSRHMRDWARDVLRPPNPPTS